MPKEQINTPDARFVSPVRDTKDGPIAGYAYRYPRDGEGLNGDETWEWQPALFIGWTPGTVPGSDPSPSDASMNAWVEVEADEILRLADSIRLKRDDNPSNRVPITLPAMTRAEAQKLIRVVKRARDAVFGADE